MLHLLADLVKYFEEKLGVSAASPSMMIAAPAVGAPAAASEEEKSKFNVVLVDVDGNKIAVINVIREITEFRLKKAEELVNAAPTSAKEGVANEKTEAKVELK